MDERAGWYNFLVPTPFYHLSLAEDLIAHRDLPETARHFLTAWQGEFLFGSTAPDVQVVSGQPRQQTHFFNLPIRNEDSPPWELFLAKYPYLADAGSLPASKAAFLTGYLCHLQADWMWVKEIFAPVFGPHTGWSTFNQRLYLHNVLRAYLDRQILPKLPQGMDRYLSQVLPDSWLPFVYPHHLIEWRDLLAPQLMPGAATQTVDVFCARQGISPFEFCELLDSKERMQHEVFDHLPLTRITEYHQRAVEANIHLLSDWLAPALHQFNTTINGDVIKGGYP